MQAIIATFIIILAILADYFWLDATKKRWGWMRDWSTLSKVFFFSGFITVLTVCKPPLQAS
ncbi:hypothetical protein SAMN04487943_101161 [Gracilibacillus orientalis]|uniref:Uncharacterized protein n=1 Tax=Gracilibacillus orientalis TaxID=334253 RepID=A0A1I4H3D7_9BACI|nr:hypothetical protein [Gracilibacillus orientalis]SFL36137.1 hypothetical protein SAMN04487943_101161 [Gracilibacillus orientalis]